MKKHGIEAKVKSEFAFVENFFTEKSGLHVHELSFYYVLEPKDAKNVPTEDFIFKENDKGVMKEHPFVWVDIDSLSGLDFRPKVVKDKLVKGNYNFEHFIFIMEE